MRCESNRAEFVGTIGEDVQVSHQCAGIVFYKVVLHVRRASGTIDEVLLIVRDSILQECDVCKGSRVSVKGTVQSHLEWHQKKLRHYLRLYVQVIEMKVASNEEKDKNEVLLSGTVCNMPIFKQTPLGKTIVDFSIISKISLKKSFKIWCIACDNMAYYISGKDQRDSLSFHGRFQSRGYAKKWKDGEEERITTNEILLMRLIE